jgi:hypothetical protein
MKEIDWSKAPEGATHAGINAKGSVGYFYRLPGVLGDYDYWNATLADAKWSSGKGNPALSKLITRPSPAWSGEGLPPVGTVCDYKTSLGLWVAVEITGHARLGICFVQPERGGENYVSLTAQFRPRRTPEQIAAYEREAAIEEMRVAAGSRNNFPFAELYDAGYRKQ